ncbi:MAG: alpha/beta hydrolase [Pirellulales bacterium]|nr:alpha/beta hydrolase [Pirellulales bacterium]
MEPSNANDSKSIDPVQSSVRPRGRFMSGPVGKVIRSILRIAGTVLVVCLVLLAVLMYFEESLIFFPSRYPDGFWKIPPELPIEDARFEAADGTQLHGWYLPHEHPNAVILFCHGNAGNITNRLPVMERLHDDVGASVLIFDYRGYGRSDGSPDEEGVIQDARAARAWLAERAGVDESEIVLLGRSLGGAVAVDLAAQDGARGLILQSTFTSIPDVAKYHYPWLPARVVLRTRLDALSKIASYDGPLLQSHGRSDTIVPYVLGKQLYEAANEPKRFLPLENADHNDSERPEYYQELKKFIESLP